MENRNKQKQVDVDAKAAKVECETEFRRCDADGDSLVGELLEDLLVVEVPARLGSRLRSTGAVTRRSERLLHSCAHITHDTHSMGHEEHLPRSNTILYERTRLGLVVVSLLHSHRISLELLIAWNLVPWK